MATSSRVENVMMTAQERHGHIFSLTDKQRMEQVQHTHCCLLSRPRA